MKFTVSAQTLVPELRLLAKVVPSKPAMPVLSSIFVHADKEFLTCYASDLEIGFRTTLMASVQEPGVLTLPAKRLLDLTEQVKGDTDMQISSTAGQVFFTAGKFRSRLQTQPVDDFPDIADEPEGDPITLPTATLLSLVKQVRYAIADKSKYLINGALMQMTENTLGLVGTDGKRLSLATVAKPAGTPLSVIIPTKALDSLTALFSDGIMNMSHTPQHLFFRSGNHLLLSRRPEGEYPAYDKIIPRDTDKHVVVNRAELAAAIRRVGLLSDDSRAIILSLEPGKLTLSTSSQEAGDANEEVEVKYDGPPVKLCSSWEYVLDYLSTAASVFVTIDCSTPNMPALLGDGADFINVIMLMRQ